MDRNHSGAVRDYKCIYEEDRRIDMKIEVKQVSKEFKKQMVLKDINVTFESGNIYGLIGRNGSGKSVFLKLLCALYCPTKGEILFNGENVIKEKKFPPSTGALIEKPSFIGDLTGFENLKLLASIQKKIGEDEINAILKKVELYEEKDKKYSKYSLGMKQKLGIAQALMEDPDIIILDEPFSGVEDETARSLRNLLLEEKKKGKLIIVATHMKEDLEKLATVTYRFQNERVVKQENQS